jgi:hypothetical protein
MKTDADGLLAARFAASSDDHDDSDWGDVLRRADARPVSARRRRLVLLAAAALAAIVLPALALSAGVRELVGLGERPSPDYGQARLAVSAPIPGGRVARVWTAPSTTGGECQFVTIDAAGSTPRPVAMTGGGRCTLGHERLRGRLSWSFSKARREVPVLEGRVGAADKAARVELRWHGGSQRLAYSGGSFVAAAPALQDPAFDRLPYDLVVYAAGGQIVERSRIPTSFLYLNWKRVQPRLHRYRVAHGCDPVVVWRCTSR